MDYRRSKFNPSNMGFDERKKFHSPLELARRNDERRKERERESQLESNLGKIHEAFPQNQGRDGINLASIVDADETTSSTLTLQYVKDDNTVGQAIFNAEDIP